MHHTPEAVTRERTERKAEELLAEQDGNFDGNQGDTHRDDERHNGQAGQEAEQDEQSADNFDATDKGPHHLGPRKANLGKATGGQLDGLEEFLDSFGQENAANHEADEHHGGGGRGSGEFGEHASRAGGQRDLVQRCPSKAGSSGVWAR